MIRWRNGVVLLVAMVTFVYRFNTLGGALGGFDNDHFLHVAYAQQVEAGEQPLRDFLDGGLQGARPSLTYELSAAARRLLGDNLWPEALLTVGAIALAAAVTCMTAASIAPLSLAVVLTLLTVFVSPKLYGYPKVIIFAVASWLFLAYDRRPSSAHLALLAVCGAAAFLFRHDYAVYYGVGVVALILVRHAGELRVALWRLALLTVAVLLLLGPSLLWVQRHAGLLPYLQNSLDMGRREAQRTDMSWPRIEVGGLGVPSRWLSSQDNAEAWLYYVFLAVPILALVVALRDWRSQRRPDGAAFLATACMTLPLSYFFLRGSLEARFGDAAAPLVILAAGLIALPADEMRGHNAPAWGRLVLAVVTLGMSSAAVWSLGSVTSELERSGLLRGPLSVMRQAARVTRELRAMPAVLWDSPNVDASTVAAQYLNRCTRPEDRVFVLGYAPELFVLANRRFAGGRATVIPGFYTSDSYARFTLARLSTQSVPIVLTEHLESDDSDYFDDVPQLQEHLHLAYRPAGRVPVAGDRELHILARLGPPPVTTFGPQHWPCFR